MRVERRVEPRDLRESRGGGRRDEGTPGLRSEQWAGTEESRIFFRENVDESTARDIRLIKQALGIRADVKESRLIYGSLRQRDDEIALLTRSIMEIMVELADGVEVPDQHVAERRVRPASDPVAREERRATTSVRIRTGSDPPQDAYVAVRYRGRSFWIDHRDLASKRIFTFLRMSSAIAETGVAPQIPVLTIPAN